MKNNRHEIKRIILVGKAASGKDYMKDILVELGLNYGVTYTTRPMRAGEIDKVDYHFISEEEFILRAEANLMYEYVVFNKWFYGTGTDTIRNDYYNVFIMTPSGISKLTEDDRRESYIIYINASDSLRFTRLLSRGDKNDSIDRRIKADNKDFAGFVDFDYELVNEFNKGTIMEILSKIKLNTHA